MSAKATKVILIIGAVLLFVLLFNAPRIAPPHSEDDGHDHSPKETVKADNNANIDVYVNMASKNLEPSQKTKLDKLVTENKLDSAVIFWDKLKRPDIASLYTEKIAAKSNKAEDWFKAGNRYYYSIQFTEDKTEVPLLYQSAMRCFSKGLKLKPDDSDAKIMLASCFIEGTQDPMQGVAMLREVEKTDSNNIKLQLSFAFNSVNSGQLDKAVRRFNKVLAIDSNYIEAYLHLAQVYEQQGKIPETVSALEKYTAKTTDVTARLEIEKYIQQLKK